MIVEEFFDFIILLNFQFFFDFVASIHLTKNWETIMYRPLSPHLFIYQPQFSSIFSVLHRITGSLLAFGLFFSIFLLKFSTLHISYYSIYFICFLLNTYFSWLFISAFILLFYAFFYHLSNGFRHLLWDFSQNPKFLQPYIINKSAYFVALFALLASSFFFFFFFSPTLC